MEFISSIRSFFEVSVNVVMSDLPMFTAYLMIPPLFEGIVARIFMKQKYPVTEARQTILIGMVEVVLTGITLYYLQPVMDFFYNYRLFTFERNWMYFVGLAFVSEFVFYYAHLISHHVRWFWNEHQVHHSPEEMNLFVGNRNGWTFGIAGSWFFAIPFVLLGFEWIEIITGLFIILNYQFFVHTELVKTLGPLEYVLNTPSIHRVHHATQDVYIDKNFGGVTIVYDWLFGTLQRELPDQKPIFGLRNQKREQSLPRIVFGGWIDMCRQFYRAPSLREKFNVLVQMKKVEVVETSSFKKAV